jgi:WD40 repeat protein
MTHSGTVRSAQFSPDGKRIVTASEDATARIWDAQTGQQLGTPIQPSGSVSSAQFSPDGQRIVTASGFLTGEARIWNAQTGKPLTQPMKHGNSVASAQFSPDGKRIVTASRGATVWDAQTGQRLTELAPDEGLLFAQFSPDGKRILTTSTVAARVWDAQTGQALSDPIKVSGPGLSPARFSPKGKRILTSEDNAVRLWDIAPSEGPYPDWLLPLSEAISGQVLNQRGLLEPTKLHRDEIIKEIRQRLNNESGDDEWLIWGRWLLADRATRAISPFSRVSVPEYHENRFKERNSESFDGQNRKVP